MTIFYFGIDASIRSSGLAMAADGKTVHLTVPIESAEATVASLKELKPGMTLGVGECEVLVLIECPTWSGHGTKEVRAAVTTWERILKKAFPRKVRILRVDPREWQKLLLEGVPGATTKERARFRATRVILQDPFIDLQEDQADALCLLELCQMKHRRGEFDLHKQIQRAKRKGGGRG